MGIAIRDVEINEFVAVEVLSTEETEAFASNIGPIKTIEGERGEPFEYEDFTPEQLEKLRGPQGIQGPQGEKGPVGPSGPQGERGYQGIKGDAFEYEDFTPEQLEGLKGPKGDKGDRGETGPQGPKGEKGADGTVVFDVLTEEQKESLKGEKGEKGDKGDTGATGPEGPKGDSYNLTDEDRREISEMITYVQDEEPENAPEGSIWVDEDAESDFVPQNVIAKINDGISVIDTGLTYARGIVEIRKIGSILWIIDSGVYNFTSSFATAKNRTVLQFELPKALSNKLPNVNGVYGGTGTIGYFPALAYENVTYTTFNCQSYLKRSAMGTESDTYQLVYTGLSAVNGGGLCGFHLKMPLILIEEGT